MSDEGRTAQLNGTGPYMHFCSVEGCGKWGGWGFRLGAAEPQWWCYGHYPYKRETAQDEAATLADELGSLR
nr:hypothetical protein [Endobacterium cereale]